MSSADILEPFIVRQGYSFKRLDGQTPPRQRLKIVEEFNKSPQIFLLLVSTRAGGVGLNLTSANIVVIFDPNWCFFFVRCVVWLVI